MTRTCRYVGSTPDTLESGRPVAAGDTVEVDTTEGHNAWLVESGRLVVLESDRKLTGRALQDRIKELTIEGASGMSADQKRAAVAAAEAATTTEED